MRIFSLKLKRVIKMLYMRKELLKTYKSNYQIEKAVREQKVFKIEICRKNEIIIKNCLPKK